MWENASIVRSELNLRTALTQIETFLEEDVGRLLFLRLLTAKSILTSAIERKSSLGAHFIKEN
jgi:L-aspartate oxidase